MQKQIFTYSVILSLFLFVFTSCQKQTTKEQPVAKMGVLDLRDWDFEKDGAIELKGEWEMYWEKLLEPKDFIDKTNSVDKYINLPGYWNKQEINKKVLDGKGYATFRLILFLEPSDEEMMITIKELVSSYNCWWNEKKIASNGIVSETKENSKPAFVPVTTSISGNYKKVELIIQVSNYHHRNGGLYTVPTIGLQEKLIQKTILNFAFDLFLFGSIIIMAFYHFGLFFMRRKNKAVLFFGILTLVMSLRVLVTGSEFISIVFPDLSWFVIYRIEYLTFYLAPASFAAFIYFVYKKDIHKWVFFIYEGICLILLFALFLPTAFISQTAVPFQFVILSSIFYFIFILIKAVVKKREGAWILLFSITAFLFSAINDMLFVNSIVHTFEMLPIGVFIFILGQSLVLAKIFTKSFVKNEELTTKLNYQNINLEKIVSKRTKEVTQQKQKILEKNEELNQQNEEIRAQRDEIKETKEEIQERHNQLRSSIRYASTIQKDILPIKENFDKLFNNFIIYLPKDVVSGDFYWYSEVIKKPYKVSKDLIRFIAVVDCTGHGVPGAFMSMIGSQFLKEIVNERKIYEPNLILEKLDYEVKKFLKQEKTDNKDGMDVSLCRIEKNETKNETKIIFAGAKHSLYYYKNNAEEISRIRGTRKSIGGLSTTRNQEKFVNNELIFHENDIVYLMTDGLIDQNNEKREKLGSTKLMNLLFKYINKPLQEQKEIILSALKKYMKKTKQRDDITLIGIKL